MNVTTPGPANIEALGGRGLLAGRDSAATERSTPLRIPECLGAGWAAKQGGGHGQGRMGEGDDGLSGRRPGAPRLAEVGCGHSLTEGVAVADAPG